MRTLTVSQDKDKYNVRLTAKPNHQILGSRLKKDFKIVSTAIAKLSDAELNSLQEGQTPHLEICGHQITKEDLYLNYEVKSDKDYCAASMNGILVLLDCTTDKEMMSEGLAREVVNRIQKLRKKAHLVPTDKITVTYNKLNDAEMKNVMEVHKGLIETSIKSIFTAGEPDGNVIITEEVDIKDCKFMLTLCGNVSSQAKSVKQWPAGRPNEPYLSLKFGGEKREVLLKAGDQKLDVERLQMEAKAMFQLFGQNVKMTCNGEAVRANNLEHLGGKEIDVWV